MGLRHMFKKHVPIAATCLLLLAITSSVMAVEVELTLDNGKVIRGQLVSQNDKTVILKVVGIETRYERSTIKNYEEILSANQEYEQRRAKLKVDDLEGRYKLASWLYQEKKAYNLAEKELVSLQKDFPQDQRVPLLLKIVRNKRTLQTDDTTRPTTSTKPVVVTQPKVTPVTPTKPEKATDPGFTSPLVTPGTELLSEEQMDLLKIYEVNLNNRPRIIFKRNDLEDFITANVGKDPAVPNTRQERDNFLNRLEGYQQLALIFKVKARDFYDKARVLGDPEVFKEFKVIHRTYVMNRCATSDCHGGDKARGLFLFNRRPGATADQIVYTNFYILNSYTSSKGGQQYDMIDRTNPDRSLLLQFGLVPEDTVFPHPPVRGMQAAFLRGREDKQYEMISNWIKSLFNNPSPGNYGVDYRVPGSSVATPITDETTPAAKP